MDLDNPVVQLCQRGMRAESEGRVDEAQRLFDEAWRIAADDYEACVAAHYVARHQADPRERLRWNEECLRRADLVGDERVAGFYPSLHLNLARAYADLGRPDAAREQFRLAARHLDRVPPGPYADWMRLAVADGLRRCDPTVRPAHADLAALVDRLRERGDLRSLALLLPAYQADLGGEADRARLVATLQLLTASGWLADEEDRAVSRILANLALPQVVPDRGADRQDRGAEPVGGATDERVVQG